MAVKRTKYSYGGITRRGGVNSYYVTKKRSCPKMPGYLRVACQQRKPIGETIRKYCKVSKGRRICNYPASVYRGPKRVKRATKGKKVMSKAAAISAAKAAGNGSMWARYLWGYA